MQARASRHTVPCSLARSLARPGKKKTSRRGGGRGGDGGALLTNKAGGRANQDGALNDSDSSRGIGRQFRGERKCRDMEHTGGKILPSSLGRKGKDSPSPDAAARARFETYLQIRTKRQSRLNARSRNRKRRLDEATSTCPICNVRLTGTIEELNGHAELCLRKQRQGEGEEEAVDVEGDGGEQYEEYSWAGTTRIRASTLLPGGLAAAGFQTCKRTSEDEDLNVDGDDSEEYGRPQFTENDLIPLSSNDAEGRERLALRGAMLGDREAARFAAQSAASREPSTSGAENDLPLDLCQSESGSTPAQGTVAAALAARVKELTDSCHSDKQHCLICTKPYDKPLVSIRCWHVLCERCWFHTLGLKKLCPQCSVITSPSDLRRIFL
ncbi:hypothetical protein ACOMHN_034216 [Nucella lapillus]